MLTAEGRAGRWRLEDDTDRLGAGPFQALGVRRAERLADLLALLAAALRDAGDLPIRNPIGLPSLDPGPDRPPGAPIR